MVKTSSERKLPHLQAEFHELIVQNFPAFSRHLAELLRRAPLAGTDHE